MPPCRGRKAGVDCTGGDISSNGGAGLPQLAERRPGLPGGVARLMEDGRQPGKVRHDLLKMLRQRVFAIALGYEDADAHDSLRGDVALRTACGLERRLGLVHDRPP